MTENKRIEFRKERDFGQLISASFEFIKVEFKTLMRLFVYIAGPMLVFSLLISIPSSIKTMIFVYGGGLANNSDLSGLFGSIGWSSFASIFQGFAGLLFFVSVYEYIRLYEEGKMEITVKDVWEKVKKNFWMFFGAGILVALMIGAGMIFLLIPGIYLAVASSFTFMVITMERVDVGKAIGRSMDLIKGNWWSTFGYYLVNIFIQLLIIYTVALPLIILNTTFIAGYFATGAETLPFWYYIVFTLFTIVSTVITMAGSLIMYVAVSFKYFSLVEVKEQIGLKRQIAEMGNGQEQDV
ncbi:MAG: hypothetical protein GXO89_06785 [Chlorobi bacterium]|nr:hypothetical protein [Chlorobiota bacterium]